MAFDGITIANMIHECKEQLLGGRLSKIAQPETDELLLTIKTQRGQARLLLSANASLPLFYLTPENKPSPATAPNFCMLLRKHIQNGRIVDITQVGLERIVRLTIEHMDELGDLRRKVLILEIMGKHSNIIFCNEEGLILDSIKHISGLVSSKREVLPGKDYMLPPTMDKHDLLATTSEECRMLLSEKSMPIYKAIYTCYAGLSPVLSQEICYESGVDADLPATALTDGQYADLYAALSRLSKRIKDKDFSPQIAYTNISRGDSFTPSFSKPVDFAPNFQKPEDFTVSSQKSENFAVSSLKPADVSTSSWKPVDFAAVPLTMYSGSADKLVPYASMSDLLRDFYAQKSALAHIRQKSSDLRRVVQSALERSIKKYDLQQKQLQDTEDRDKYRIYGELLHTYGYQCPPSAKCITVPNYMTGEDLTIPLDPTLSPVENAARYFDKYNKMKRTSEALGSLTVTVQEEIAHLESISNSLDIAATEADLAPIKAELIESGYLHKSKKDIKPGQKMQKTGKKGQAAGKNGNPGKAAKIGAPLQYLSTDGYSIYVGKNNYQNDDITFRIADGGDWWFHAKGQPGSHVVLKTGGNKDIPDRTFEEAASLAAYYSSGRGSSKVEIDYIQRKHVKKPVGTKPGFVVYYTNYSLLANSDISGLTLVD
jgi:predicted ribosome quality control (RQC) complex YloA/Tae2 family protein